MENNITTNSDTAPVTTEAKPETNFSLRALSKEERDNFKKKIVAMVEAAKAITTRELAKQLNVKYSQIYLPLRRLNSVKEVYGEDKKMYWVPAGLAPRDAVKGGTLAPVAKAKKAPKAKAKAKKVSTSKDKKASGKINPQAV